MSGTQEWLMVQNDGELDLRLLELMGASTKDGVSTIGMFGTGMKYGIALALRKKMGVIIFSGNEKIEFSTMPEQIRETTFQRVAYSLNGKRRRKTSMTTLLGDSDWDDEWLFLREVISNAFDEEGFRLHTFTSEEETPSGVPGYTRVFISLTPRIREVLDNTEYYVRRHGEIESNTHGKIFPPLGEKGRVYKRGIFVRELPAPSLFDYDLSNLRLTESRSADTWEVQREVRETLTNSSVESRKQILRKIEEAKKNNVPLYESDVEFYDWDSTTQKSWSEAFTEEYGEEAVICEGSQVVVESLKNMGRRAVTLPEKVAKVLRNGGKVVTERQVVGNGASEGFVYRDPTPYESGVLEKGSEIMRFLYGDAVKDLSLRVFKKEGLHADTDSRMLSETDGSVSLLLNEGLVARGTRPVVETMYEEIFRFSGCSNSYSERLITSAKKALIEEVLPKTGVVL